MYVQYLYVCVPTSVGNREVLDAQVFCVGVENAMACARLEIRENDKKDVLVAHLDVLILLLLDVSLMYG